MSNEIKGERVAIERNGNKVSIVLMCRDEYHAMELYDLLNLGIEQGYVELSFGVGKEMPGQ